MRAMIEEIYKMNDEFIKQTQDVIQKTTEQFRKQTEDLISAAKDFEHPDKVKELAEENIQKSKALYANALEVTQDAKDNYMQALEIVTQGTQKLGEKALNNFNANSKAAFDAMQEMAGCKSANEAREVMSKFLQNQMEAAGHQTKEFVETAQEVAQHSGSAFQEANQKTTEKIQKMQND